MHGRGTTKVYSGVGADIVMESITLKPPRQTVTPWNEEMIDRLCQDIIPGS
jgi:hypothetical protein